MSHITRIFHCNVGHRGSWRPPQIQKVMMENGDHAPFSIIQLENGGGKTTDISLILAIFEPNLRRFLPNLSQLDKEVVARQFQDYFHASGIPGIVAVEFVTPTGPRTDQKRIVGYVASCSEGEVERDFFMIVCPSDLLAQDELAALPGGPSGTPVLRTRAETRAWLKLMNGRAEFTTTAKNRDWEALLLDNGFDLPGLKMLLDINRRESNGNMGFFAHRTERDFLVSVLGNLVDEQDAADNFHHYALMREKIARLEPRRRALKLLETLRGHAERHATKAEQLASSTSRLALTEAGRVEIFAGNLAALDLANEECLRIKGEIARVQDEADRISGLLAAADAAREGATTSLLTLRHEAAEAGLEKAASATAEADLHDAAVLGAEILSRSVSLAERRRILQERIDADNDTVQPYVDAEASAKGVLARVLTTMLKAANGRHGEALLEEKSRLREENDLADRVRLADQDIQNLRLKGAKLESEISHVEQDRNRLESDGVLVAGETASDGLKRLEREKKGCGEEHIRLVALKSTLADKASRLTGERTAAADRRSTAEARIATMRGEMAKEEIVRRNCMADEKVAIFFSGHVDIGTPGVTERLSEACATIEREIRDLEFRRVRLTSLAGTVARHDVVFDRPDAERVLEKLRDHGFAEAQPGGRWLSDVARDPSKAADAVRIDPLSLDLVVPSTEMLARCIEILGRDPVDVLTPVTISVASSAPAADGRERFVAMPADAREWNVKSAADFAEKQEIEAASIAERIFDLRSTLEAYRDAVSRIGSWITEYGPDWTQSTQETINTETLLAEEIEGRIATLEEEAEDVRIQGAELSTEFENLTGRRARIAADVRSVSAHAAKEENLASKSDEIAEIRTDMPVREAELAGMNEQLALLVGGRTPLALRIHAEKSIAEDLGNSLKELGKVDMPADEQSIVLEDARAAFATAENALLDMRKGFDKDLSAEAESLTEQIGGIGRQFEKHLFRHVGLDRDRCEGLLADIADFDAAIAEARQDKSDKLSEHNDASGVAATRRSELDNHIGTRRHPEAEIPSFPDEAFALSAIDRISERRTALAAEHDLHVDSLRLLHDEEAHAGMMRNTLDSWILGQKGRFDHVEASAEPTADIHDAMKRFGQLTLTARRLEAEAKLAKDQADGILAGIKSFVSRDEFVAVEAMVSQNIKESATSAFLDEPRRLVGLVEDRIDCTGNEIESLDDIVEALSGRLRSFLDGGIRLLKDLSSVRIPATSPVAPNRSIIRFRKGVLDLSPEMREIHMRNVVEKMTVNPLKVQNGISLLVDLVLGLCGNNPGIEVLKPSPTDGDIYVPYASMSHSGGEKLSVGMMFFAAYARVSCKNRGRPMRRCGTMILDNPLGAMTSANLWETTLSVLRHMEVQVVAYTGVMEANVHRQFPYHVVMGRFPSADGYTNVRPVDFVIAGEAVAA